MAAGVQARKMGVIMSVMTARTRVLVVLLVLSAAALVWAGGFVLSSQDSRCTDGLGVRDCTGTFSSDTWHAVGLAAVAAGLITLVAPAVVTAVSRRRTNTNASRRSDPDA